jgi:hypothetical protein
VVKGEVASIGLAFGAEKKWNVTHDWRNRDGRFGKERIWDSHKHDIIFSENSQNVVTWRIRL